MTKTLEKKSVGAIEKKSGASAKLDLALARSAHVARIAAAETVDVPRVCAVHDKPYIATFQRGPNGWRLLKTTRTKSAVRAGNTAPVTIYLSKIDPASPLEVCAWCGTPGSTFQGKRLSAINCECGDFICLGRKQGSFFQCRDSCNASGEIGGNWISSQGTTRKEANPRPVGSPDATTSGKEPLRLSAGAALTKKGGK